MSVIEITSTIWKPTVPLGCVCGDADGYIAALVQLAFINRDICTMLGIGSDCISRVRQEMINTSLRLMIDERTQELQAPHNEAVTQKRGMQACVKEVVFLKM